MAFDRSGSFVFVELESLVVFFGEEVYVGLFAGEEGSTFGFELVGLIRVEFDEGVQLLEKHKAQSYLLRMGKLTHVS